MRGKLQSKLCNLTLKGPLKGCYASVTPVTRPILRTVRRVCVKDYKPFFQKNNNAFTESRDRMGNLNSTPGFVTERTPELRTTKESSCNLGHRALPLRRSVREPSVGLVGNPCSGRLLRPLTGLGLKSAGSGVAK